MKKAEIPVLELTVFLGFLWIICLQITVVRASGLKVGYYRDTCPEAESIVRTTVSKALQSDPTLAAALIRMHFHDCFVRGCDGSILLDSTPQNIAEKDSPANNPSLRGYEVIDKVKQEIESKCPQVVSYVDILAFVARDCAFEAGRIQWEVPAGRRDGRISKIEETIDLPTPFFNVNQLTEAFAKRGLSQLDMVILSGAHSIGVSHCSSFSDRLYNFTNSGVSDPSLDANLANQLKLKCPQSSSSNSIVPLEPSTPIVLDNNYYMQLLRNRGLLASDQTLTKTFFTWIMVVVNALSPSLWSFKFGEAMVRMGDIEVLIGAQGEIRKNCRVVL